jgi:type II secretory pathway component PulL
VLFVVVSSAQRDQVRRIAAGPARLRVRRIDDADTLHDHHPKLTEADNATFWLARSANYARQPPNPRRLQPESFRKALTRTTNILLFQRFPFL